MNYDWIKNIFIQRNLSMSYIDQVLTKKNSIFTYINSLDFWCWRYVFMKDITTKHLTSKLHKMGYDNLTIIEIVDALNKTKALVKEMVKEAKTNLK